MEAKQALSMVQWASVSGPYEALGQRFTVRTTHPAIGAFIAGAYEHLFVGGEDPGTTFDLATATASGEQIIARDGEVLRHGPADFGPLLWLVQAINRLVVEQNTDRILLHAAGAAIDGKAVLLPAPMESGKSTLVTELVRRGFTYLSDEAICIEPGPSNAVRGFLKPIGLDPGSWHLFPELYKPLEAALSPTLMFHQWVVPIGLIGKMTNVADARCIIFPRYEPGARLRLTECRPGAAIQLLLDTCFPSQRRIAEQITAMAALMQECTAMELVASSLKDAADAVEGCLKEQ